jgi:hypothetical protein
MIIFKVLNAFAFGENGIYCIALQIKSFTLIGFFLIL